MRKHRFVATASLAVLATLALLTPATAGDDEDGWRFGIVPLYLWATDVGGSVTTNEQRTNIDIDFGDILDATETGFTGYFEAGKGNWSFWADYQFADLRPEIEESTYPVDVKVVSKVLEVAVAYRLAEHWEIYGGGRFNTNDFELAIREIPVIGDLELDTDESINDALVGARFKADLSRRWKLSLRGDIATGSSDFAWQAFPTIGFLFTEHIGATAGYRVLGTRSESTSDGVTTRTDMRRGGFLAGVVFVF